MIGAEVSGPLTANDFFSLLMTRDVKYKGKERPNDSEVCFTRSKMVRSMCADILFKGT